MEQIRGGLVRIIPDLGQGNQLVGEAVGAAHLRIEPDL